MDRPNVTTHTSIANKLIYLIDRPMYKSCHRLGVLEYLDRQWTDINADTSENNSGDTVVLPHKILFDGNRESRYTLME